MRILKYCLVQSSKLNPNANKESHNQHQIINITHNDIDMTRSLLRKEQVHIKLSGDIYDHSMAQNTLSLFPSCFFFNFTESPSERSEQRDQANTQTFLTLNTDIYYGIQLY